MSADRDARRRLAGAVVGAGDGEAAGARWGVLVAGLVLTVALAGAVAVLRDVQRPGSVGVAEGDLLVGATSGARYLDLEGRLHPLLNTASARLLVRTGTPRTVVVPDEVLRSLLHGPTLGIPGAPDDLPPPSGLTGTRWTACPDGTRVRLSIDPLSQARANATTEAVAVVPRASTSDAAAWGAVSYLVVGGYRLPQPPGSAAALRGALQQPSTAAPVPAALLDLLSPGAPLDAGSLRLGPGVGAPLPAGLRRPGVDRVGQLVDGAGSTAVVLGDGLLPLDPFSAAVYEATAPSGLGRPVALSTADVADLPPSARHDPAPSEWPRELPRWGAGVPCVRLDPGTTGVTGATASGHLVLRPAADGDAAAGLTADARAASTTSTTTASPTQGSDVTARAAAPAPAVPAPAPPAPAAVAPGTGGLVRVGPVAADGPILLVDGTGTAYPLAAPGPEVLVRLGYADVPVASVPAAWAALLPRGPTLDPAAARRGPA